MLKNLWFSKIGTFAKSLSRASAVQPHEVISQKKDHFLGLKVPASKKLFVLQPKTFLLFQNSHRFFLRKLVFHFKFILRLIRDKVRLQVKNENIVTYAFVPVLLALGQEYKVLLFGLLN